MIILFFVQQMIIFIEYGFVYKHNELKEKDRRKRRYKRGNRDHHHLETEKGEENG